MDKYAEINADILTHVRIYVYIFMHPGISCAKAKEAENILHKALHIIMNTGILSRSLAQSLIHTLSNTHTHPNTKSQANDYCIAGLLDYLKVSESHPDCARDHFKAANVVYFV